MNLQSLVQYKKSKRRERAARMAEEAGLQAVTAVVLNDLDSAEEDTDLLKLKPPRPPRPKKVRETLKEPLYEEEIIEGFSVCSFKTYEDLEVGLLGVQVLVGQAMIITQFTSKAKRGDVVN
jgi:hypothetical protein